MGACKGPLWLRLPSLISPDGTSPTSRCFPDCSCRRCSSSPMPVASTISFPHLLPTPYTAVSWVCHQIHHHHTWIEISCGSRIPYCRPHAQPPCLSTCCPSTQQHLSFRNRFHRACPPGTFWHSPYIDAGQHVCRSVICRLHDQTVTVPKSHPDQQGRPTSCPSIRTSEAASISLPDGG